MDKVFLSLGSNIGDRYEYLKMALYSIQKSKNIEIVKQSTIYETEPVGLIEQEKFLNMVVEIKTSLPPLTLLKYLNRVERQYNRRRDVHWGPRTIDIDILLYGDLIVEEEILKIPHPFIKHRLFVLVPLLEIYDGEIPGEDITIKQLIEEQIQNIDEIKLYKRDL